MYVIARVKDRFTNEKKVKCWFRENKENFFKGFMVIAVFSYYGKLTFKKVEKSI